MTARLASPDQGFNMREQTMEEEVVAAAALAAIALQSATLKALVINGILTAQQGTDTIDDALLMVEDSQAQSPELQKMHAIARKMIEQAFLTMPKPEPKRP
jgi:hypothetical protein